MVTNYAGQVFNIGDLVEYDGIRWGMIMSFDTIANRVTIQPICNNTSFRLYKNPNPYVCSYGWLRPLNKQLINSYRASLTKQLNSVNAAEQFLLNKGLV